MELSRVCVKGKWLFLLACFNSLPLRGIEKSYLKVWIFWHNLENRYVSLQAFCKWLSTVYSRFGLYIAVWHSTNALFCQKLYVVHKLWKKKERQKKNNSQPFKCWKLSKNNYWWFLITAQNLYSLRVNRQL